MANLGRKMTRLGVLAMFKKADGTVIGKKSVDGWWQGKRAELAESKRATTPPKHPLDRRIERAIKKATSGT